MGNLYCVMKNNVTPTAGQDVFTIQPAANRRVRFRYANVQGNGSSSAAQSLQFGRSTAGATGGSPITPDKYNDTQQPAAASTVNTTWTVQPTIGTNTQVLGFNALGGNQSWTPIQPGGFEANAAVSSEMLSVRALASGVTYQALNVMVLYEED
jgi:hypothetical protein